MEAPVLNRVVIEAQAAYPTWRQAIPPISLTEGEYQLSFATEPPHMAAVQALRFQVFHKEIQGLRAETGLDEDVFDAVCHHLLIYHIPTRAIVGTYRLQTNDMAAQHRGFYSAQEYCFADIPKSYLHHAVEIGRVCIAKEHRNGRVLRLLWKGVGRYLSWNNKRFVFGCSSLFSQDTQMAHSALHWFATSGQMHPEVFVKSKPAYHCPKPARLLPLNEVEIPRMLKLYLAIFEVKVCSEPALDRHFNSIDFLTLLDITTFNDQLATTYLAL